MKMIHPQRLPEKILPLCFFLLLLCLACSLQPAQAQDLKQVKPAAELVQSQSNQALINLAQRTASQPLDGGTLENGLQWIVLNDDRLPVCRVLLAFPAGTASEPEGFDGIAGLSLRTLVNTHSGFKSLRRSGSPADVIVLKDFSLIALTIPVDRLITGLEQISEAMKSSSVQRTEVNSESDRARDQLETGPEIPFVEAVQAIEDKLYQGCGYSHPPDGTRDGIRKTTWNHANEWLNRAKNPSGMMIIFSGAVPADFPGDHLLRCFSGLKSESRGKLLPEAKEFKEKQVGNATVEASSLPLSDCVVGFVASPAGNPDYPALKFLAAAIRHIAPDGIRAAGWYPTQQQSSVFYLELFRTDGQPIAHTSATDCLNSLDAALDDPLRFCALQETILTEMAATRMTAVTRADQLATTRMAGRSTQDYKRLISDLLDLDAARVKEVRQRILNPEQAIFAGGYSQ